jgi:hypothetical protein
LIKNLLSLSRTGESLSLSNHGQIKSHGNISRYHEQMPQIIHEYLDGDDFSGKNTKGMPLEVSSLINDTQYLSLDIEPNKKYLLRIASVCAHLPHVISFGKWVF